MKCQKPHEEHQVSGIRENNMSNLINLLKLSHVPRWAVIDTIKSQSVADHTFRMMAIGTEFITCQNTGVNLGEFLELALIHDADEAKTGDIPTPCKNKKVPRVGDLPPTMLVLKIADIVEAIGFIERYGIHPNEVASGLRHHLKDWTMIADIQLCLNDSYNFCEHLIRVINAYD